MKLPRTRTRTLGLQIFILDTSKCGLMTSAKADLRPSCPLCDINKTYPRKCRGRKRNPTTLFIVRLQISRSLCNLPFFSAQSAPSHSLSQLNKLPLKLQLKSQHALYVKFPSICPSIYNSTLSCPNINPAPMRHSRHLFRRLRRNRLCMPLCPQCSALSYYSSVFEE